MQFALVHQTPQSMGFPRQEYRSGSPFPSPGDLSDLGIKPVSPVSPTVERGHLKRWGEGGLTSGVQSYILQGYLDLISMIH